MLMNNKFKAQTLTGDPTGNYRCQLLASRALNMSCYFSQSARSIESRCVVKPYPKEWFIITTIEADILIQIQIQILYLPLLIFWWMYCFTWTLSFMHSLILILVCWVNTLRPRQNGRHFPDDIFKCIFLNENIWISIKISLKFVPKGPINNIPALVQIMAWRRPGDKPSSEPMMVNLPTHICVTRPQWVKT